MPKTPKKKIAPLKKFQDPRDPIETARGWQWLELFVQENGHINVQPDYVTRRGFKLGRWLLKEKRQLKVGRKLDSGQIKLQELLALDQELKSKARERGGKATDRDLFSIGITKSIASVASDESESKRLAVRSAHAMFSSFFEEQKKKERAKYDRERFREAWHDLEIRTDQDISVLFRTPVDQFTVIRFIDEKLGISLVTPFAGMLFLRSLEEKATKPSKKKKKEICELDFPNELRWKEWAHLRGTNLSKYLRNVSTQLKATTKSSGAKSLGFEHQLVTAIKGILFICRLPTEIQDFVFENAGKRNLSYGEIADTSFVRNPFEDFLITIGPHHMDSRSDWSLPSRHFSQREDPITPLVSELANPRKSDRIFVPSFGAGALLVQILCQVAGVTRDDAPKGRSIRVIANVFGAEASLEHYIVALLQLISYGFVVPGLSLSDGFENPQDAALGEKVFDCVVAMPPYGLDRGVAYKKYDDRKSPLIENIFVKKIMSMLKPGGRVVVVTRDRLLWKKTAEATKVRQSLVEEFHLDGVISLPERSLINSVDVPLSILVFRQGPQNPKIRFAKIHTLSHLAPGDESEVKNPQGEFVIEFNNLEPSTSNEHRWKLWEEEAEIVGDRDWDLVARPSGSKKVSDFLNRVMQEDETIQIFPLNEIATLTQSQSSRTQISSSPLMSRSKGYVAVVSPADFHKSGRLPSTTEHWAAIRDLPFFQPLKAGDVLVGVSAESVGMTTMIGVEDTDFIGGFPSRSLAVIRIKDEFPKGLGAHVSEKKRTIMPSYIECVLRASPMQEWFRGNLRGDTNEHLSLATLGELPIPIVSMDYQGSLVAIDAAYASWGRRIDTETTLMAVLSGEESIYSIWTEGSEILEKVLALPDEDSNSITEEALKERRKLFDEFVESVAKISDLHYSLALSSLADQLRGVIRNKGKTKEAKKIGNDVSNNNEDEPLSSLITKRTNEESATILDQWMGSMKSISDRLAGVWTISDDATRYWILQSAIGESQQVEHRTKEISRGKSLEPLVARLGNVSRKLTEYLQLEVNTIRQGQSWDGIVTVLDPQYEELEPATGADVEIVVANETSLPIRRLWISARAVDIFNREELQKQLMREDEYWADDPEEQFSKIYRLSDERLVVKRNGEYDYVLPGQRCRFTVTLPDQITKVKKGNEKAFQSWLQEKLQEDYSEAKVESHGTYDKTYIEFTVDVHARDLDGDEIQRDWGEPELFKVNHIPEIEPEEHEKWDRELEEQVQAWHDSLPTAETSIAAIVEHRENIRKSLDTPKLKQLQKEAIAQSRKTYELAQQEKNRKEEKREVQPSEVTRDFGSSPYIVGNPVDRPEMLYGRYSIIGEIKRNLRTERSANVILLEGNRRAGKTSILRHLERVGELVDDWIVVYCSFQQGGGDLKSNKKGLKTVEVFKLIAKNIGQALDHQGIQICLPDQEPVDPNKKFGIQFSRQLRSVFKTSEPFEVFQEYLEEVLESIAPRGLLLMLDEIDVIQQGIDSGLTNPQVLGNLRYLLHEYSSLSAILCGSRRIKKQREEYWSAFFGLAHKIAVSALEIGDANRLVTEPVAGTLTYDEEARNLVVSQCVQHPFLIQTLCNKIFERAARQNNRRITRRIVNEMSLDLVEDNEHFRTLWDETEQPRRRLILFLIQQYSGRSERVTFEFLEEKLRAEKVPTSENDLSTDLDFLRELELIEQQSIGLDSFYELKTPLFSDWIRKNEDFKKTSEDARVVALRGKT